MGEASGHEGDDLVRIFEKLGISTGWNSSQGHEPRRPRQAEWLVGSSRIVPSAPPNESRYMDGELVGNHDLMSANVISV